VPTRWLDIWCAACARGGTLRPSFQDTAAQSPIAKISGSRVVCSVLQDHELVLPVGLQSVDLAQHIRAADSGRPDGEVRANLVPALRPHAPGVDRDHRIADQHLHTQLFQRRERAAHDVLGQARQDARPGLEDGEADLARGIEVLQPVRREHADGVVQLRGELHAGRARADDRDVDHASVGREVGAEAGVHQAPVEEVRLPGVVDREGVLAHPGRAEVVRLAADPDHQRVIRDAARGQDLLALVVDHGGDTDVARPGARAPRARPARR
jgi:hypothetical protein